MLGPSPLMARTAPVPDMVVHAARDHAQWSASSTERNWTCVGTLALTENMPDLPSSDAADWGTCCHQISEKCLVSLKDPVDFIGTTEKGKIHEYEVDEEMAETAAVYVDYVREKWAKALREADVAGYDGEVCQIEQKFSLADLKPPFEAGGTADAVIYFPVSKSLEVIDLKGGRGRGVEAKGNKQMRTYGLGSILANVGLDIETVTVTIVQPRKPHKSGRIRSETFHISELLEWTIDLVAAMHRSKQAILDRPMMNSTLWEKEYLEPGDHCTFCKAEGCCPALTRKALDAAGVWFDNLDNPRLANTPSEMTPEEAARILDACDMIEGWINAVRAYWHGQAESGIEVPNYILVERQGRRKWNVSDETVLATLKQLGVEDPYTRKILSPAQSEKAVGTKKKAALADLIDKPITGTNLVRADKSTRSAVQPSVNKFFNPLD